VDFRLHATPYFGAPLNAAEIPGFSRTTLVTAVA
jgi:hypothetical protein